MKKITVLAAGLLLAGAAFAGAEGFKLSGYLRAGWANTIDALDTDADGDGDTAEASTETWLAGDYFGGSTRSRLNLSWSNKDDTAGAYVRFQYTGAAESFDVGTTKYAYAWVKPFDGLFTVAAGKMKDDWIGSDGWEGVSFLDGNSGFFAGINPIEGLTLGGGAVVDLLPAAKSETVYYINDEGKIDSKTSESGHRASKNAVYFGAKYAADAFTFATGYALAGEFYANLNYTAVENLLVALEFYEASDDCIDDGVAYTGSNEMVFVENIEYTGIDRLTLGIESYQYVNDHENNDDSNITATINPAVRYEVTDTIAASLEATTTVYSYDNAPDAFTTIVPAVYLKVADGAEANVYAVISTDTDQAKHAVGAGVIFNF